MLTKKNGGLEFAVRITPGARSNEVVGWENGVLKIRVTAAPERGKANDALVMLLAKWCDVRLSQVLILSGYASRNKRVRIEGLKQLPL